MHTSPPSVPSSFIRMPLSSPTYCSLPPGARARATTGAAAAEGKLDGSPNSTPASATALESMLKRASRMETRLRMVTVQLECEGDQTSDDFMPGRVKRDIERERGRLAGGERES